MGEGAPAPSAPDEGARKRSATAWRRLARDYLSPKTEIPTRAAFLAGFLFGGAILLLWCAVTYGGLVPPNFLPAPHKVVQAAIQFTQQGRLPRDIWASAQVVLLGFVVALVATWTGRLRLSSVVTKGREQPCDEVLGTCET